jgi:hypothetical protein
METCRFGYSSAELLPAYLSGDKQLLFAIEQSMTFTVITISEYSAKWLDAGECYVWKVTTTKAADLRKKV